MGLTNHKDKMNSRRDTPNVPKPYVLTPSGDFDGNDGRWSSFYINLGDDGTGIGQNFKVLIATSSPITIIPGPADWCNQDCAAKRGVETFDGKPSLGFDKTASKAWKNADIFPIPLPTGYNGSINGLYGTENVGLGESSKTSLILAQQFVALPTDKQLFMGSFGLSADFVSPGKGSSQPSFLVTFAKQNQIPSKSYGYSAGASYRNNENGMTGNVVLGGYDESRVKLGSGVSISMPSEKNYTLCVGVKSIIYSPNQAVEANSFSLTADGTNGGFLATIDSTLPYFILPDKVCDLFIERFQLTYDNTTDLFLVNSSSHDHNTQQNATVTFKIMNGSMTGNGFTSIDLPYSAFNLESSFGIYDKATRYFPLKRSTNGMFVLGRTLLQESYLIVDYERLNFTIAPAIYSDPMPQQKLVSIYNKTYAPPTPTPTLIPKSGGGLSPGAVAGIVVGVVLAFLLAGLGGFFWWKKRRASQAAPPYTEKPSEIDTEAAGTEVKHRRVSELDSEPAHSPKPSLGGFYDREGKDISPFPPISEMESPGQLPAELYSPPLGTGTPRNVGGSDYFIAGNKVRRRGATRESSGNNTPGTPVAELAGDDGRYQVAGIHFEPVASPKLSPTHTRGPSETPLHSKIDAVVARPDHSPSPARKPDTKQEPQATPGLTKVKEEGEEGKEAPLERRPSSHARGLSDTTVQSDDTAVSAMTPEEMEQWALGDNEPRRPLSE